MINTFLKYASKYKDSADAIIIVNCDGIIEYSAILSNGKDGFISEGIIGKGILDVYPSLTTYTSSHYRVMNTGKPIINEKQTLIDELGSRSEVFHSTFPIYAEKKVIGSIEMTKFVDDYSSNKEVKNGTRITVDSIVGKDEKINVLKKRVLQLAPTDNSILLIGDTGTGKELLAQALHNHSLRSSGPFVSINVAAIPNNLIESTLFGTERGSFTGAVEKQGVFEEAHMGTLFLDELNSMDITAQSKILRAIETKSIRRVGGSEDKTVDIRIISAMNISGEDAVKNKSLRSDLFFRLAVAQLTIPSLSKRVDDIEVLANYFLKSDFTLSIMVKDLLRSYKWPGNVRELKNAIDFAMTVASSNTITIQDIPEYIFYNRLNYSDIDLMEEGESLADMTANFEKSIIEKTLSKSRTLTEASKQLKLTRQALRYKMGKYNIQW